MVIDRRVIGMECTFCALHCAKISRKVEKVGDEDDQHVFAYLEFNSNKWENLM